MLHFTKEIDYGLLLIAALAELPKGQHISLREISKNKKLPYKFLGKIIIPLKRAGIVESIQGVKGGYSLKRDIAKIGLSEVIGAYETELAPVQCLQANSKKCQSHDVCTTRNFWSAIHGKMAEVINNYTVQDLINQK